MGGGPKGVDVRCALQLGACFGAPASPPAASLPEGARLAGVETALEVETSARVTGKSAVMVSCCVFELCRKKGGWWQAA